MDLNVVPGFIIFKLMGFVFGIGNYFFAMKLSVSDVIGFYFIKMDVQILGFLGIIKIGLPVESSFYI